MSPVPQFSDLVASSFDLRWAIDPVAATAAGLWQHDARLGVFGVEDVRQYVAALKAEAAALEGCEPQSLADEIDRTALLGDTRLRLHEFERERPHERNPAFWLSHLFEGLYLLLARQDRSMDHRRQATRGRLAAVGSFLALARTTLTECPRVFTESAIDIGSGGDLLFDQLGIMFNDHGDGEFAESLRDAREATADFVQYLHDELLPQGTEAFAVGEEAFHFRLRNEHAIGATAPALWRYGHRLAEETTHQIEELTRQIAPSQAWPDLVQRLREDHPAAAGLVQAYADEMARARRFVDEHGLAPIPEGELLVVATPPFLRPLTPFAAYQPPGAYSSDRTGWFYVTTPDGDPDGVEAALREHSVHDIPSTALHEGYPGHHLQFLHALAQPRPVRQLIGSAVSIEGWALYCEDMMAEEGFFATPEQQLFQKVALLWRAMRIVLDVGLHTRGMAYDEAVDLLASTLHFGRAHAQAEVRRYCAHPCYQLAYAEGRRELKALRADYRDAAGSDFSLRRFHEHVLSYGGLPVALMRWGMGLSG